MSSLGSKVRHGVIGALMTSVVGLTPNVILAQDVILKSTDGTVNVSGQFLDFSEGNYLIRTALGDMRVSASRVFCEGAACPTFEVEGADVIFGGSDTVGEGLMPLLISGYAASLGADAEITNTGRDGQVLAELIGDGGFGDKVAGLLVDSKTSGVAFSSLLEESVEIGMASRRIRPQEARDIRAAGGGNMVSIDQEHVVAIDSIVVIVHPENPIDRISVENLAKIYAGEITNWSEVGGPSLPITVATRPETSGTRARFEGVILGEDRTAAAGQDVYDTNNTMAAAVNGDPGAIGYSGAAFTRGAKPLSLIASCGITVEADSFSAKTEEYVLQRRLYLYNREDTLSDKGKSFVDYSISDQADGVIAKSGFIDLGIVRRGQDLSSGRARDLIDNTTDPFELTFMRDLLTEMQQYDRLSTTFRFATGSTRLDNKATLDLERLVSYVEDNPNINELLVVGFTDSVGAFEANMGLSDSRAKQVVQQIKDYANGRLDNVALNTQGYGALAPASCNDNIDGQSINRRVEIWVPRAG